MSLNFLENYHHIVRLYKIINFQTPHHYQWWLKISQDFIKFHKRILFCVISERNPHN